MFCRQIFFYCNKSHSFILSDWKQFFFLHSYHPVRVLGKDFWLKWKR